jgi:glycosyltransferase involved in cell wall biosynthesis
MQTRNKNKKIAFLCPYPFDTAPSQRFRYEQYLPYLTEADFKYQIFPFLDPGTNSILYHKGFIFRKMFGILKGFFLRWVCLPKLLTYDYVFLHREACPLGPPFIEWVITKILRKKVIYDFDDAIWKTDAEDRGALVNLIKNPGKINSLIRWSYKISGGNEYLCSHAKKYNRNVICNPTTIDTEKLHNKIKDQHSESIVIGWTGTHSTLIYLTPLIPVIGILEKKYDFNFIVICNKKPDFILKSLVYVPWIKKSEIEDLLKFNIGLMPLEENEWTLGKCGFKALQYMSLGIPALVSPVGVNKQIVTHGKDGFLCESEKDWLEHLSFLIENEQARIEMGKDARKKIQDQYSVTSNKMNFINLFS